MDNRGFELSDLDYIEFFCENPQVELYAAFRPGIDTPFPPTTFNDLEMGEVISSENPIVLKGEEDHENSPPTTPASERPTDPPKLLKSRPLGTRIENLPDFFDKIRLEPFFNLRVCNFFYI